MTLSERTGAADVQRTGTTHYATLDAMRGIAAVMVMLSHVGSRWGGFGYLAVDLFFLMSGFVVARAYETKLATTLSIATFMKIRTLRLYPALLFGILVALVCRQVPLSVASWWEIAKSMILLPDMDGGLLFPLNPVLWSLFFELAINVVHAIGLGWLTTRRLVIVDAVAGAAYLYAIVHYRSADIGWGSTTFLAGFARVAWSYFAGVLIARCRPLTRVSGRWPGLPVLLVTALLLFPGTGVAAVTALHVMATVFLLFPLCIYLAIAARPVLTGRRLCEALGGLSYPLYTIHYPLVGLTAVAIRRGNAPVTIWFVVLPTIILLAYLVERFYDAPIRGWLRERYRPPVAAAIAAK